MSQQTDDLKEFTRPDLSEVEIRNARKMAAQVFGKDRRAQVEMVSIMLLENMILTKEVNQHREALGYKPLKVYS